MYIPKELKEEQSIKDPSGHYKGIWLRDMPKDPTACYKHYLCVENTISGERTMVPAKRFFYWGKSQPYFELMEMEFDDRGLVAKVKKITDTRGNRRTIHLNQDLRFDRITIKISRNKFPN